MTASTIWRTVGGILGGVCLLWGALPLIASRIHTGCVTMIGVGAVVMLICWRWRQTVALWQRVWETVLGKTVLITLTALVGAVMVLFVVVSCMMAAAACRPAPENATLVVLGAGLRGERPSRTLRERLAVAYDYLMEHPDAVCILTGGQGPDELISEAEAMRRWLVDKGIDEGRLYVEDKSTSTDENFEFSRQVAQQHGLSLNAAVVTQEFHQCRAQLLAQKHGFDTVGAVTAHTKWDLFPSYWIRDFAGLCRLFLLGR